MAKLRIFVSSTVRDLEKERAVVKSVLNDLCFETFLSEYESARAKSPEEACVNEVTDSDIFLLLVGSRYGAAHDGNVSPTHAEFLRARELRKPILIFVRDGSREPREEEFLESLGDFLNGRFYAVFKTEEDLRRKLLDAVGNLLVDLVRHNYVTPWKRKPNVVLVETADEVAHLGAKILAKAIRSRPYANIGLSAGRTAGNIYFRFFQDFNADEVKNIVNANFFSVTEHFGISPVNPNSYYHWYHQAFFNKAFENWRLSIPEEHKKLVPSTIERNTVDGFRIEYDQYLQINKVDLQIISPAPNGQIICLDPNSYSIDEMMAMGTFLVRFSGETSKYLVPMSPHDVDIIIGMRNLLGRSERLVIPAYGAEKKEVVRRMILGPVASDCPASLLNRYPRENNLVFIIDRESSQGLPTEIERHVKLISPDQWETIW